MTTGENQPKKPWTWRDGVLFGVVMSVPVGMITVGISAASGEWIWALLTVPVMVALSVTIGWIANIGRRSKVFVAVAAITGLLIGTAAGVTLVALGISFNFTADVCDPEVSRCRVIINGVMRGETDVSAGSQRFRNFLISLAMILPGLLLIYTMSRLALQRVRKQSDA